LLLKIITTLIRGIINQGLVNGADFLSWLLEKLRTSKDCIFGLFKSLFKSSIHSMVLAY
jgi:hypothetical protein